MPGGRGGDSSCWGHGGSRSRQLNVAAQQFETVGMGVRRLTAFLEKHRDVYRDELFGKNRLVIDGSDLTQQLYFDSGRTQLARRCWGSAVLTRSTADNEPNKKATRIVLNTVLV